MVKLSTYKKLYLLKDKTAFLEFEDCFIEIPQVTPSLEKYIREASPTMIFFATANGQKEFVGSLVA